MECLPYKLSPLSDGLPLPGANDGPSSTTDRISFLTAYPVLIPLYLAEYHDLLSDEPVTFIAEAHTDRVYSTRTINEALNSLLTNGSKGSVLRGMAKKLADSVDQTNESFSAGKLHLFRGMEAVPASDGLVSFGLDDDQHAILAEHIQQNPAQVPVFPLQYTPPDMDDSRVQSYIDSIKEKAAQRMDAFFEAKVDSNSPQTEEQLDQLTPWWSEWKQRRLDKSK